MNKTKQTLISQGLELHKLKSEFKKINSLRNEINFIDFSNFNRNLILKKSKNRHLHIAYSLKKRKSINIELLDDLEIEELIYSIGIEKRVSKNTIKPYNFTSNFYGINFKWIRSYYDCIGK